MADSPKRAKNVKPAKTPTPPKEKGNTPGLPVSKPIRRVGKKKEVFVENIAGMDSSEEEE